MNHAHVENKKYPRGDLRFSTWIFEKGGSRTNFPVKICKVARSDLVSTASVGTYDDEREVRDGLTSEERLAITAE